MKCLASQPKSEAEKIKWNAVYNSTRVILIALASVLTDKYGYGRQKVHQVIRSIEDRADSINKGYIKLDDLEEVLRDEYGIVIQ